MKQPLVCIALLFLLLAGNRSYAQVYPVSGNSVLIPPYSVYLSDYTEGTSDRLVMNLVLNDVSRPELRVRLRMKIMSQNITLETKPQFIGRELVLEGGVPLRLTGLDLLEYFNPENLNFSGISKREFEKTGALPANFYQFCFEVLEYNRGVKISNTICANGWLILNDPPIINLPRNAEKVNPTQPQNVIFQWTPRHTGSPNSAFTTEYDIKVVELWPSNRNPNDAMLTSPPIMEASTRGTTFIYDVSQTPLELGRHYALQIKAKSIVGADELDLFKNNGKSEVVTFVYGDPCNIPMYVTAQPVNPTRFKMQWTGQFNHTGYQVRYRAAGDPAAQWFLSSTMVNETEISGLKANTTYEYQVLGGCGIFESVYTPVATVTTKPYPVTDYSCGLPIATFNLDPSTLIASLKVGDYVQAGDFEVQLTKVTGSNGSFSGEGIAAVPMLNNVKVKTLFENITVTSDKRMVKGYMNVTGAALDIVPDQLTAMMDELTQALDEIDAALDMAEDVLGDIDAAITIVDKVLTEMKDYPPDPIITEITDARAQIAAAKDAIRNAETPEAKEAAQVQLKAAKDKLKEGVGKAVEYYAQAIVDILKILKESISELANENKNKDTQAATDFEDAEKKLDELRGYASSTDSTELIVFHVEKVAQPENPSLASFTAAAKDFLTKKETVEKIVYLKAFVTYYADESHVKELGENLKNEGVSLLQDIALKLKNKEDKSKIKEDVKANLKAMVYSMIRK